EPPLLRSHPPNRMCARHEKSRSIRLAATIVFFRNHTAVIFHRAFALVAVGCTNALTVLSDLHGSELKFWKRSNKTRYDARLPNVARVSAYDRSEEHTSELQSLAY